MDEFYFPYNLPIWRDSFKLESPNGKSLAEIPMASESSMGKPTIGTLYLSNGFELTNCNPSFIWSDDSRYLAVPRYFRRFGLFLRQKLVIIDTVGGKLVESKKTGCYFQAESFLQGQSVVTLEPFSDREPIVWHIPADLNQLFPVKDTVWTTQG